MSIILATRIQSSHIRTRYCALLACFTLFCKYVVPVRNSDFVVSTTRGINQDKLLIKENFMLTYVLGSRSPYPFDA